MSDQGFHEIQLSGKQLVFLFMSLLVLAVVVFLLGVSVGRGVRGASPGASLASMETPSTTTEAVLPMPPPTQTPAKDLDYSERLQGRGGAAGAPKVGEPPAPPAEAPPMIPLATAPQSKPAAVTSTQPATPPPAPGAKPWTVQVMALKSKESADGVVAKLKSHGFAAYLVTLQPPNVPYHVRVGPFAQKDDASHAMDRLLKEEGYKTSVIH